MKLAPDFKGIDESAVPDTFDLQKGICVSKSCFQVKTTQASCPSSWEILGWQCPHSPQQNQPQMFSSQGKKFGLLSMFCSPEEWGTQSKVKTMASESQTWVQTLDLPLLRCANYWNFLNRDLHICEMGALPFRGVTRIERNFVYVCVCVCKAEVNQFFP